MLKKKIRATKISLHHKKLHPCASKKNKKNNKLGILGGHMEKILMECLFF